MDAVTQDSVAQDVPAILRTLNSTFAVDSKHKFSHPSVPYLGLRTTIPTLILLYILYRLTRYFTHDLPPLGSKLKRLPGPISTLPYIGRVHDVDRMQAWTAFHKFSKQYNGLYSCTLGGETHIWVAREDVAQDLLVKHAGISSARADLGAFPGVTEDYKYLPLLGYTGEFGTSLGQDGVEWW